MPRGSGRRPLPTAVKKLRGNAGKRKLNEKEPRADVGEPPMPKLSAEAASEWKRIVPELLRLGVLTVVDGKALAAYCHAFARWLQAEREIQRLGLVLRESVFGTFRDEDDEEEIPIVVGYKYKRNPAVAISNEALKLMKSFLVEFGMTPAARTRIRVEKPPEEDPFESYMSRGGQSATKLVN